MAKGKSGMTRKAEGGSLPEFGHKRVPYSVYKNEYNSSEAISGTYDKETKTIEVRTYPRMEKAFELIPDSLIAEWAKAFHTSKRQATFKIYYAYRDDLRDGVKVSKNEPEWVKKLVKHINKYDRDWK